ncbi:MAG TPA: MBL fold metallo-hydrolase [Chitinophagaceae bacterium]|nr:MBL fold metallo-hydrolase [Chitinophagaceae bacterium]
MCLYVSSLNSGSNGNCYYIGTGQEAVLIDAGISCREIEKRLKKLNLAISKIKAVFISHEHTDHIKGVETLSSKYQVPVYITSGTFKNCSLEIERHLHLPFAPGTAITIGGLSILPFRKYHDAADPNSFVISYKSIRVGVFTDIGHVCESLITHFSGCTAAFLETNYDEKMLDGGNYPYHLKQRIKSKLGHLSNLQALELFTTHRPAFMSHIFLSHLSENNNHPRLVEDLFTPHAGSVKIIIAPRNKETSVYEIYQNGEASKKNHLSYRASNQLSFFPEY